MNNYEFCVRWVLDQKPGAGVRILDYGCGAGQIVKELRGRGSDAFGCDVFYEGGDLSKSIDAELFDGGTIKRMDGNTIPFDSSSFDFVINNQVMEHVKDLDDVLAEICRVMKPRGAVLSLFPHRAVWHEGHCGIPFLHWFPKNSRTRVYYAAGLRTLGFGYFKGNKRVMHWSREFCEWLDKWTYYRTKEEVHSAYGKYFSDIRHIEDYWIRLRLGGRIPLVSWLPARIQKLAVMKLAGMVFIGHKPA